jgi:hypothetical protein
MKVDVIDVNSGSHRHGEGLNGAIQVLVIERVLIVPDASVWSRDLVTDEENAVASRRCPRSWLDLIHRCASPSHDRRLLLLGVAYGTKSKGLVDSSYGVLLVGSVVIHVALVWMTLASGAFVRHDVFRLGKIGRPRV